MSLLSLFILLFFNISISSEVQQPLPSPKLVSISLVNSKECNNYLLLGASYLYNNNFDAAFDNFMYLSQQDKNLLVKYKAKYFLALLHLCKESGRYDTEKAEHLLTSVSEQNLKNLRSIKQKALTLLSGQFPKEVVDL